MINQSIAIGLASSLIVEALKLFPFLSATDTRKRTLSFIVALILAGFYLGTTQQFTWANSFSMGISVISMSFAIYKLVIQPVKKIKVKK